MNDIQKERNKKLREEAKNDLKVFKLEAEIRRNNEQQLEQQLGYQKSLTDFHKPVTEKLEEQETARKKHYKAIKDYVDSSTTTELQAIEAKPSDMYYFDQELDVEFLEKNQFPRPSKLYNVSKEVLQEVVERVNQTYQKMGRQKGNVMSQIARMTKRDEEREDNLITQADYLNEKMLTLDDYRGRLKDLLRKDKYLGKGIGDKLDILAQFTDKLCNGSKSKKLLAQVADLLDALLTEGTMTSEQVKQYYKNFILNK